MVSGDGEELPTALLDTGPGDPVHEAADERTLTAASACGSVPDIIVEQLKGNGFPKSNPRDTSRRRWRCGNSIRSLSFD